MSRFLRPKIIALLLTPALLLSSGLAAQDAGRQTRPRRVGDAKKEATQAPNENSPAPEDTPPAPKDAPPGAKGTAPAPRGATSGAPETTPTDFQFPEPDFKVTATVERLDAEPSVRVALATDARAVS
ncbi:MAG TPA: hypothetical protein VGV38_12880, partial [Pyrinomonadaceae bacterium]|nr:hypothetical protein [Pyrinomonadaceae bacterium]